MLFTSLRPVLVFESSVLVKLLDITILAPVHVMFVKPVPGTTFPVQVPPNKQYILIPGPPVVAKKPLQTLMLLLEHTA